MANRRVLPLNEIEEEDEDNNCIVNHIRLSGMSGPAKQVQVTRMMMDGMLDAGGTRRALEVIDRNAQLQAQLVADLLDVSRIVAGRLHLDPSAVTLGPVIEAALDAVRPAAEARRVQVVARLSAADVVVQGDGQRLQQIVWNLLSNAVKFSKPDGTVVVELQHVPPSSVRLRVSDDGEGIDPEFLPHVFERFSQADALGVPSAWRPRARAGHRPPSGRPARRNHCGGKRGSGPRRRIHRRVAGGDRAARRRAPATGSTGNLTVGVLT